MDKKTAKAILVKHQDALKILLESDGMANVKAEAEEAIKSASEGSKALKKSLLDRVKEFPVVQKVSELGTAGTIAVSTAAVAQTELATDLTQVFVADVANDVVEQRFEVPTFIDNFVDFHVLNDWGQTVISEKVSELQQTSQPSPVGTDPTPESSSSSQDTSSDTPSQTQSTEQDQSSEETESKTEQQKDSSNEGEQTEAKEDNQEETQEGQTEEKQESQESSEPSSEPTTESEPVKAEPPIVETPMDPIDDPIKPHSTIRQVSPVS